MISPASARLAGRLAYVAAAATLLGFITLMIFFAGVEPFGPLNDILSVVLSVVTIPLVLALHALHRSHSPAVSVLALVVGIFGLLLTTVVQSLLIVGVIPFAVAGVRSTAGFSLFGASLAVYCALSLLKKVLPQRLAVFGVVAGLGYALLIVGFCLGGPTHPLTAISGLLALVFFTLWTIGFGRQLLAGKLSS